MTKRKTVFFAATVYALLVLGTAISKGHSMDDGLPSDSQGGATLRADDQGVGGTEGDAAAGAAPGSARAVSVGDTRMPVSFRGTKANTISGAPYLNAAFRQIAEGGKNVRILQIGDSHVKGKFFPRAVERALEDSFGGETLEGVDSDCSPAIDGGITFDYIGINGAHASRFASDDMQGRIAQLHPDVVIISFGTNEAHGNFDSTANTLTLDALISGIRQSCPGVVFLLTTPPGSYIAAAGGRRWRDRRGRWHSNTVRTPNQRTERVAENITQFARDNKIAVWDIYNIAGGSSHACANWRNAGLMNTDQIHFTAAGYELQGSLLGEAIVKAYNDYVEGRI